ncbi:patatin-like phospholipase family protein [Kordiimonas gwangyangensis]|uniref:patatin-like phospholipase family protein n=1 Tax=Kordiimonas gwangyangensis TaxID=288022 RepID=UPI00035E64FF|nr:patatin-like phospholipase family protein [Kordiimonas gwangyangensis]
MLGLLKKSDQPAPRDSETTVDAPEQPAQLRRPKVGLALGAGVARGWAHIGVIKRLQAEGIHIDMIAGTSIGAVVGGAMASGNLDVIEEWACSLKELNFLRLLDLRFGSGLFGSDKLNRLMEEKFGNVDFSEMKIPFTAVACELKSGHEIWLDEGEMSGALRASFAIPGIFEPQKRDGRWLVDGALVNPVPVSVCRAAGCDIVIAVNLSEDLYGRNRAQAAGALKSDDYGVFTEGAEDAVLQRSPQKASMFRKFFGHKKDEPSMFANLMASLNIMQNRLSRSRLAGDPPDVSINPRIGHIGLMEFHRAPELIEEGVLAFDQALPQLRDALAIITHRINH